MTPSAKQRLQQLQRQLQQGFSDASNAYERSKQNYGGPDQSSRDRTQAALLQAMVSAAVGEAQIIQLLEKEPS